MDFEGYPASIRAEVGRGPWPGVAAGSVVASLRTVVRMAPGSRQSEADRSMTTTFTPALISFIRAEVMLGNEALEAETDLVVTGLVDSLGVVLIVEWIETELEIEIDPGDVVIEHFESVAAMVAYLRARGDCTVD